MALRLLVWLGIMVDAACVRCGRGVIKRMKSYGRSFCFACWTKFMNWPPARVLVVDPNAVTPTDAQLVLLDAWKEAGCP